MLKDILRLQNYSENAIRRRKKKKRNGQLGYSSFETFSIFFLSIWGSLKLINGNFTLAVNEPLFNEFSPRSKGSIFVRSLKSSILRWSLVIHSFVYIHFFRIIKSDYIIIVEIIIRSNNYNFGSICISFLNFDCHSGSKGARIYTLNSCKQDKNHCQKDDIFHNNQSLIYLSNLISLPFSATICYSRKIQEKYGRPIFQYPSSYRCKVIIDNIIDNNDYRSPWKQFRRDQPLLFADRSGGIGVTVERGLRRCKVARRKRPTSRAE